MECVIVQNSAQRFDEIVHAGPPEGGDLEFVIKPGAMVSGASAVCVTFTSEVKGELVRVQAVTSVLALQQALQLIAEIEKANQERN